MGVLGHALRAGQGGLGGVLDVQDEAEEGDGDEPEGVVLEEGKVEEEEGEV